MHRPPPITLGAILAGGRSRRFGRPKALAVWRGRPLIEWVADAHRAAVAEFSIVTNEPALGRFGAPLVADRVPGSGPVAGLDAALHWAAERGAEGVWLSPCDTPLVTPELAADLVSHAHDVDAVLPRSDGPLGYEPLFGWYATAAAPIVTAALASSSAAMHDVVARLPRVVFISVPASHAAGGLAFRNVNTPEDLSALDRESSNRDADEG